MKTRIIQITTTILFALVIVVGNVYADDTKTGALINESNEYNLEIENWMINDSVWDTNNFRVLNMETVFIAQLETALETEPEKALEVESWMTNNTFTVPEFTTNFQVLLKTQVEANLELENWMTNESIWNK